MHLRVLTIVRDADRQDVEIFAIEDEKDRQDAMRKWRESGPAVYATRINIDILSGQIDLADGIIESCLEDLIGGVGFVQQTGGEYEPRDPNFRSGSGSYTAIHWHLTRLGRTAADEVDKVRCDIVSKE